MRTKYRNKKKVKSVRTRFPIKKTKKVKSKRTIFPPSMINPNVQPGTIQNRGGFLLNPPTRCERKRIDEKGMMWCDFGCCWACGNPCKKLEWFMKASGIERLQYLRNNGVRI